MKIFPPFPSKSSDSVWFLNDPGPLLRFSHVCHLWNTPLGSVLGYTITFRVNNAVGEFNAYKLMAMSWVLIQAPDMFYSLLPLTKPLKLYCLKKNAQRIQLIKRLSALFMVMAAFLSVNSEYFWLKFQCQVVCYTIFVVCFQAVWTQWPQKILLRKLFRRDPEGSRDPSCQVSSIYLGFLVASSIWVLFRRAVLSFMNESRLSWHTK